VIGDTGEKGSEVGMPMSLGEEAQKCIGLLYALFLANAYIY
jgi:hypothetical protein